MASEPDRPSVSDDAPTLEGGERTAGDGNWPVSDLYYVDPDATAPGVSEPDDDTVATVVAPAAAPASRRKFPPNVGVSAALALFLLAGALLLGAVLLGAGDDDPAATAQTPTGPSTPLPPGETTPAPPATPVKVEVGDVEGRSLSDASTALEKQGFEVRVTRSPSERPRGEVLNQEPPPGSKVPKGTVVALVASRGSGTGGSQGPEKVNVPGVVGLSESDAVTALRDAGLEARVRRIASRERRGTVIDQVPTEGAEVARDGTVQIEVAKPPLVPPVQRVEVPDVVGAEASAARRELRAAGFRVTTVAVASQQPVGTVISQSPRAGAEVREGARVRLTVSSGPAAVAVPNVTGLDELSARQELERSGFQVQVTDESITEPAQDGVVLRQTPSGGSSAEDGAMVTIVVGRLG